MNKKYRYKDFEIDIKKFLGRDEFDEIYEPNKKSGKFFTIKRILDIKFEEIEINSMNKCEYLIKYFGYFKEEILIYFIMKLCLIKEKKLNIKGKKEITKQLKNVFKTMYENLIIHKSINPTNILIKKNNISLYKLTNYGLYYNDIL